MKKFPLNLLASLILVAASGAVFAQGAGPAGAPKAGSGFQGKQGGPMGDRMNAMRKAQKEVLAKLNLNADQQKRWDATEKEMRDKMMKEFGAMRGNRAGQNPGNNAGNPNANRPKPEEMRAMREKMMKMREEYQKKFMAILTPNQQTQYRKLMEEAMKKVGAPGAGRRPGGNRAGGGGIS